MSVIVEQFKANILAYDASIVDELLNGLDKNAQQGIFNHVLAEMDEKQKTAARTRNKPKEDCKYHFMNNLLKFCNDTSTPPKSALLKAIFDARKKADMDAEDDAQLLAKFLYLQFSFVRQLQSPIFDQEKSTDKKDVLRGLTRADMKAFTDHTLTCVGIEPEYRVAVYTEINRLLREEDNAIIEARNVASRARSNFDSSVVTSFNTLKTTLLSAEPDEKVISNHLKIMKDAGVNLIVGKTPEQSEKLKIKERISNLSKLLLELHDEPFMKDNGFARSQLYNALNDILFHIDEEAIDKDISEKKARLGTGWFDDVGARFSIWSGYRKYWRSKEWRATCLSSIPQLLTQINEDLKSDKYKHLVGPKCAGQISNGLASARIVKNRNHRLNTLRPTLIALGSMTSIGFAITALMGITTVAFFGFALFSNPFVLPAIALAIGTFSLVRALYHLANKDKQKRDFEINLEHDSKVYHDFDDNPNATVEAPGKWPILSWMKKTLMKQAKHLTFTRNWLWYYFIPPVFVAGLIALPFIAVGAALDYVYQLGSKVKRDHKNMAKELVNYLPILCVLIAAGFLLSFLVPGFFDFATQFNLKDVLSPTVHGGGDNAAAERMFAASLPLMAFGAVSKLGGWLMRWGWDHDSKTAQFFGTVLSKTGDRLTFISIALMGLGFVRYVLPFIPELPASVASAALSLTVLVAVLVGSICGQLYTNFIDSRPSKKVETSENLEIEPTLYAVAQPTAYTDPEKVNPMTKMMTVQLDKFKEMTGKAKDPKPDANINAYYFKPSAPKVS